MTGRLERRMGMTRMFSIDSMVDRAIVTLVAALMLVIAAGSAMAHHGWSEYDAEKPATVTGTISAITHKTKVPPIVGDL